MIKVIKYSLILVNICLFQIGYSQTSPPDVAMPNDENSKLIIEIIEVTLYENYFQKYCLEKIEYTANKENWTQKHKEKIIRSIDFEYFNGTIFNMFANYSTESLKKLIKDYKKNKKSNVSNLIVSNEMVNNNLILFANSLVEGKYVLEK
jgi:hypothetical protein